MSTPAEINQKYVEEIVDLRLSTLMAEALADPGVDEHAKSLAGWLLHRLTQKDEP